MFPVQSVVLRMGVWVGCLCCCATAADTVTLTDATGRKVVDVPLREWTDARLTLATDPPREIPIDEVLSLTFSRQAVPPAGGDPLVILANGDRLVLRAVGVFDDLLTATWHRLPSRVPVKLPLEMVAAMVFDLPAARDDRQKLFADLQTIPPGADVVLLANGDRILGEFERLDGAFVHLKTSTGLTKLDRTRVQAVRMNPELTSVPETQGRSLMLSLRDGSRVTARSVEWIDRDLKCTLLEKQQILIPFSECVACFVFGKRVVPVASREPARVKFVPYLSNTWPLVKNANVLRGPLTLRGVEYGSGLGVHSRSLVTYDVLPGDHEFLATVGIDDAAGGKGSVRFAIELDGRRHWESPELTGQSPPVAIPPVKLDGAKQFTLVVEFGANADILDYADWCDALVIRKE
jgi:hypothetical protein